MFIIQVYLLTVIQGVQQPGKPGILREFDLLRGKPGKPGILREFDLPQGKPGKLGEFFCLSMRIF